MKRNIEINRNICTTAHNLTTLSGAHSVDTTALLQTNVHTAECAGCGPIRLPRSLRTACMTLQCWTAGIPGPDSPYGSDTLMCRYE
jgi:hypothetical protein